MKRRLDAILLAVAGVLFLLVGYERSTIESERKPSIFSTYDTGPNGYRALFEILLAAGAPVRRFEAPLGTLDPSIRTLVVTSYEFEDRNTAHPLNERDSALLKDFVRNGGRLVAIDTQFAGTSDAAPAVGSTVIAAGGSAIALSRSAYTAGVTHVRGPIDWIFPFTEKRGVPLLANGKGMVGVWYRFGRGEVVAVTAPALFGNEWLRSADNLRFAYNVVANHGVAAFDEYVHGYSTSPTMWGVLPGPVRAAVWLVAGIVLLALVGANVPFAPPLSLERSDERTSSDYVTAIAELMHRSRRRPSDEDVIRRAQLDFQQRRGHA
jgi:Domain of unknown function (DUF4350)